MAKCYLAVVESACKASGCSLYHSLNFSMFEILHNKKLKKYLEGAQFLSECSGHLHTKLKQNRVEQGSE